MAQAKATVDHDEIRDWVESRGGFPARVKRTGGDDDPGILRIDYPGFSGADTLERIGWDEWLGAFDQNSLAFLYQPDGGSRFSKLVDRGSVEVAPRGATGARRKRGSAKRSTSSRKSSSRKSSSRKASSSKKSSASKRSSAKRSTAKRPSAKKSSSSKKSSAKRGGTKKSSSKKARSKVAAIERKLEREVGQLVHQVERAAARTRRRITKKLGVGSKRGRRR